MSEEHQKKMMQEIAGLTSKQILDELAAESQALGLYDMVPERVSDQPPKEAAEGSYEQIWEQGYTYGFLDGIQSGKQTTIFEVQALKAQFGEAQQRLYATLDKLGGGEVMYDFRWSNPLTWIAVGIPLAVFVTVIIGGYEFICWLWR